MAAILAGALAVLLLVSPVFAGAAAPGDAPIDGAVITGVVLDAETSEPLPAAVVALPDLDKAAVTGPGGEYALSNVPPGPQHLTVRLIGYAPKTLHALAPRVGRLEINVRLEPQPVRLQSLNVRAPVSVRGLDSGDSTALPDRETSIAAVRNHPLLTEPDVFQALEGGGVNLIPETPSGIHVRGGATDQLAYLVDDVPVLSPYHAAGTASAWNPDALSRLRVTSSGQSVANVHTLAGALEAFTLPSGDRIRAQGSVSSTQARVTLDGPLGKTRATYLVSLRSGFAGLLGRKNESSHLRGDTNDWLTRLEAPALRGTLRVLGYGTQNEIDASATVGSEPAPVPGLPRNTFNWGSRSWGMEWRRAFPGAVVRVLGWSADGDADAWWNAEAGPVRVTSDRRDWGVLADVERRSPSGTLLAGLRTERARTSYRVRSDSLSPTETTLLSKMPVSSAFAQIARRLGPRVELGIGIALAEAADDLRPAPHGSLRWDPSSRVSFSGRYARAHQFAQSLRNEESIVGTIFPVDLYVGHEGTGIPVARMDEGVVAADLRPAAGVRLTLEAFARGSDHLALVAPRSGEPFSLGSFAIGSGTSRGASVEAAVSTARCGILASYGFQRVRLEYGDSSYVPEHGTRHLFQGGIIVFPTSTFSVRLGGDAAWGRRTTIADGVFEWEACNLLDRGCEFGGSPHYTGEELGGAKLPAYYRLDLGVRKHWHVAMGERDVSIALFAAVTNLLARKNVLTYSRDPSTGQVSPVEMRPRAPFVVGLDWKF
jgi:hypothetical protein